jgi:hypothetical protein
MHGNMNIKFACTAPAYLCDVGLGYRSNFTFYFDDFLITKEVFKVHNLRLQDYLILNLRLQDCLILNIKALRSVEKSVTVYQSIRCNILDVRCQDVPY